MRESEEKVSRFPLLGRQECRAELCGLLSGKDKDDVHSRAYITFKTVEDLVAFHQGYDGWSFKSKTGAIVCISSCRSQSNLCGFLVVGNISQAVVEFAPYQKTPILSAKADPRQSTIEQGD